MFSLNPFESFAQFTVYGLKRAGEQVFLGDVPDSTKQEEMGSQIPLMESQLIGALQQSPLLSGLDITRSEDVPKIVEKLKDQSDTSEFWMLAELAARGSMKKALADGRVSAGIWATILAERFRAVHMYKKQVEPAVWVAHSAKRLLDFHKLWDTERNNSSEQFWQSLFNDHSYVLPQVFSAPAVLIAEKAYVGGQTIDRKDARFVDYLFTSETSRDALLVELKTPVAALLGTQYRGIYKPSSDLAGAVVQLLDYRHQLLKDLNTLNQNSKTNLAGFRPRLLLLIGNGETELADPKKRESFELFRSGLHDIEVITFDELFRKIEALTKLFDWAGAKAK